MGHFRQPGGDGVLHAFQGGLGSGEQVFPQASESIVNPFYRVFPDFGPGVGGLGRLDFRLIQILLQPLQDDGLLLLRQAGGVGGEGQGLLGLRVFLGGGAGRQVALDQTLDGGVSLVESIGDDLAGILPQVLHGAGGIRHDLDGGVGIGAGLLAPGLLVGAAVVVRKLLPQRFALRSGLRQILTGSVGLAIKGCHIGAKSFGGAFRHLELAHDLSHVAFASG